MFKFLCVAAIAFGGYWFFLRGPGCGGRHAVACPPAALEEGVGETLSRAEVCAASGYLCYEHTGSFRVLRWPLDKGKLRVRMRLPEFLRDDRARLLRDAAIEGIMEWDGHPFPIVIDSGKFTLRFWDVGVVWSEGMYNAAAGQARIRAQPDGKRIIFETDGLAVVVPPIMGELGGFVAQARGTTIQDADAELLARVKAVAMHEMGHSLGLAHSDVKDDVMYFQLPQDASRVHVSARDVQTVDALYGLPNGAMVQ
jgi:hypothetical protein